MAKAKRTPKGIRKFKNLLGKLVKVPKAEVDRIVEQSKGKRQK